MNPTSSPLLDIYMDDVRDCPYIGWITVRRVSDVMHLLEEGRVGKLSLDHDMGRCEDCRRKGLGIGDMQSPETSYLYWCPHVLDGTALVEWMVVNGKWPDEKPTVHSANPVGRKRMEDLIERNWDRHLLELAAHEVYERERDGA